MYLNIKYFSGQDIPNSSSGQSQVSFLVVDEGFSNPSFFPDWFRHGPAKNPFRLVVSASKSQVSNLRSGIDLEESDETVVDMTMQNQRGISGDHLESDDENMMDQNGEDDVDSIDRMICEEID